jgi:hypothetical protein
VFDSSNIRLGVGVASPSFPLEVNGNIAAQNTSATTQRLILSWDGLTSYVPSGAVNSIIFSQQSGGTLTEQMRLTSTGLGIGTSSPADKLEVYSTITARTSSGTSALRLRNSTSDYQWQTVSGTNAVSLFDNAVGSARLTLDSSGNLGLGVTPSVIDLGKNFEIGVAGSGLWSTGSATDIRMMSNVYYNNGYKFAGTGNAAVFLANAGRFIWQQSSASGTAGNAVTVVEPMTLDASGNLQLGTTTAYNPNGFGRHANIRGATNAVLYVGKSDAEGNCLQLGWTATESYVGNITNTPLTFITNNTERARITSGGNFGLGQNNPTFKLDIFQTGSVNIVNVKGDASDGSALARFWQAADSGDNGFMGFLTQSAGTGTTRGSITYNRGAGLVAYNVTSDYRAKDINGPVTNSGALIDSVPVYMGKMKGATQERPMFIAHETPKYAHTGVKDAVDKDGNPVFQQMDASALIPVMWAEIQSLRQRVAQLESN